MKFGKLKSIDDVDFSLPPDPSANKHILLQQNNEGKLDFYIGCTGWSMKEWVGSVYPKGTKTKDYLLQYGKQFNTIELNTTHYRIPDFDTIQKWREQTPSDFRFCPKIPQTISHRAELGVYNPQTTQFSDAILGLGEQLGCCFMQLPPYFDKSRLRQLEQFLEQFPKKVPLAIEVRHESWFEAEEAANPLYELLASRNLATVITDVAGRRDVLHMGLTNKVAMIRFVGNGLHPTDYSRIDDWVLRIKRWFEMGLSSVYFFTHEPDNLLAPQIADYLHQQVKDLPFVRTRGPQLTQPPQDQQMSLF